MFRLYVVQDHATGDRPAGYLTPGSEVESDRRQAATFADLDEVARVLPFLDYDGCRLESVRVERIPADEAPDDDEGPTIVQDATEGRR